MIRRILTALDGSLSAEAALPYAESLARMSGAVLVLVRAAVTGDALEAFDADHPNVFRFVRSDATAPADRLNAPDATTEAYEYLAALARDLRDRGITVEFVLIPGVAAEVVVDETTLRHADLIVMSTHGRSGPGRWLHGSVAEDVVAHSPVPVLVVRPEMPWRGLPTAVSGLRLLVSLDGSATAETALPVAADLARVLDAEVFLVRIAPSSAHSLTGEAPRVSPTASRRLSGAYEREADLYLDCIATRLRSEGLRVSTIVADDQPSAGILAAAEETMAAIVVMATRGRTGLGQAILGSVALDVVRRGSRPVLLVRPTAKDSVRETEAGSTVP
jgi:nucleotide-binding universal stress UspA family protein